MSSIDARYTDGTLRQRWDGGTRTYTAFDAAGNVTESRPFTVDENARADEAAAAEAVARLRLEQEAAQAALTPDQTNALLAATAPADGQPWRQPTGAHDAYPTGRAVTRNGKTWENLIPANVWEPGVTGWREVTEGNDWPDWVQPLGAQDAYRLNAQVTHNGQHWINTDSDANTWEPGVFGWTVA